MNEKSNVLAKKRGLLRNAESRCDWLQYSDVEVEAV